MSLNSPCPGATDKPWAAERSSSPVERQRAGAPFVSLAGAAVSVEMSVDSVSERRSRPLVAARDLFGPGSAKHGQERFAVGADASSYMSHRGVGRRAIEAAHKAGGHFGRKAPVVAFDVADTRTIDLDSPDAVERPAAASARSTGAKAKATPTAAAAKLQASRISNPLCGVASVAMLCRDATNRQRSD